MRISVKGRYAIVAMACMAVDYGTDELITVSSLSKKIGGSKIYLEQVFSLLKRSDLLDATKGAQGGYQFSRPPYRISVYDILSAVDTSLFERTKPLENTASYDVCYRIQSIVFDPLDQEIRQFLSVLTLKDLVEKIKNDRGAEQPMFYI